MRKINFIPSLVFEILKVPIIFEILKFENLAVRLAESFFAFNHAHLKLHDQFVALIDMKLHAKINFIPPF